MNRMLHSLMVFGVAAVLGTPDAARGGDNLVTARVIVDYSNSSMTLMAEVTARHAFTGHAKLSVKRVGGSGTIQTNQGRTLSLDAGETAQVSKLALSHDADDRLVAILTVENTSGEEIARDVYEFDDG